MEKGDKIECKICGERIHSVQLHLKNKHPEMSLGEYQEKFPDAPVLSEAAKVKLELVVASKSMISPDGVKVQAFHEVFELGKVKAAMSARGGPIPVSVLSDPGDFKDLVPAPDINYIFPIDVLKDVMMGMELNIPTYLYGHMGTGKTSIVREVSARTRRPFLRVQHTINTEEAHILGQWVVKDGETQFQLGPLAVAMKFGLVYCADEYDYAMPTILSVYQPVLEGEPLVIKDADPEHRVIRPHQNFRFFATGNTNGIGDETGLYQGTQIGNAANYERFGIMRRVEYMSENQESSVVAAQSGIPIEDARRLIALAKEVRNAYDSGKIGLTVSPRALINAAKLGVRRGDYTVGFTLAFINRLSTVDREVVSQYMQRVLG